MKQMTFADAEYASKRKQTRKKLFLIEMAQVVPWQGLIALIEPHYGLVPGLLLLGRKILVLRMDA